MDAQYGDFAKAVSNLSSKLYQDCVDLDPDAIHNNVAVSPYSLINTFVTLAHAANGESLNQIKRNLRFSGEKSDLVEAFIAYNRLFQSCAKNLTCVIANNVYVDEVYLINKKFRDVSKHQLLSDVETVNFLDATEAAGIMNDFVVEKTNNKIRDFIKPTSSALYHTYPRIISINAVYMRIAWKNVYESINTRADFFDNGGKLVMVDFMHFNYRHKFNYAKLSNLNATALEIKLTDSDFSLLLIRSDSVFDFADVRSQLKNYDLAKIVDQMREEFVEVAIPKFKIEYQVSLKYIMKKMGITDIFDAGKADLSGLLDDGKYTSISDIIQNVMIEVDEDCPEALQDAGYFAYNLGSLYHPYPTKQFIVNEPFLYHVWNKKTKTAIISGHVKHLVDKFD